MDHVVLDFCIRNVYKPSVMPIMHCEHAMLVMDLNLMILIEVTKGVDSAICLESHEWLYYGLSRPLNHV